MESFDKKIDKKLFRHTQVDIISGIYNYFAIPLRNASEEELKEFFIKFEKAIRDQVAYYQRQKE